jgi:hypothetical protein
MTDGVIGDATQGGTLKNQKGRPHGRPCAYDGTLFIPPQA